MATFDLKKQLTIHDRGLLRQLLGNEPSMQAIEWDAIPRNNIAPLITAWESMDDAKKRHYGQRDSYAQECVFQSKRRLSC